MRRFLFLCTTVLTATLATAASSQSLRDQAPEIATQYGTVMIAPDGQRYVIYGPLNRLWQVAEDGTVLDHAWIEVHQDPFEHVRLHWSGGITDIFNLSADLGVTFTKESIPLVGQYDRLLAEPLARSVATLPAGTRFNAGGHIFDGAGAQIGDWDSHGAKVSLHLIAPDKTDAEQANTADTDTNKINPDVIRLAVADLVAAMDTTDQEGK